MSEWMRKKETEGRKEGGKGGREGGKKGRKVSQWNDWKNHLYIFFSEIIISPPFLTASREEEEHQGSENTGGNSEVSKFRKLPFRERLLPWANTQEEAFLWKRKSIHKSVRANSKGTAIYCSWQLSATKHTSLLCPFGEPDSVSTPAL